MGSRDADRNRIGFGVARVSIEGRPDRHTAVDVIAAMLEADVAVIDTADAYCIDSSREHGYGEMIVGDALRKAGRASTQVATKVGEWRPGDGRWLLRGRPEHLIGAGEAGLARLGVETIDLLQLHRPDPTVPVEESVGALDELRRLGVTLRIGVCNVTPEELSKALAVAPVSSVQNPLGIGDRGQDEVLRICEARGITFLAHSPLGGPAGARRLERNMALRSVSIELGVGVRTVALAWLLARSPVIAPIPGTTSREHALENLAAASVSLSERHLVELGPR
jgi:aryl-alcohol dehydrogenase-like predicted oxidoreductase